MLGTKKYVDDKITTLTNIVNDKISDIDVVDESYASGAAGYISASAGSTHCVLSKLLSSHINQVVKKHFHLTFKGQSPGFSAFRGRQIVAVWGI